MTSFKTEIKRINGYLKEVTTFLDDSGHPISHMMNPIMTELKPRDVWQIFIGAIIFGAPLCYTEEIWTLSSEIPLFKIHLLNAVGLLILSIFVFLIFIAIKSKVMSLILLNVVRHFCCDILTIILFLYLIDRLPVMAEFELVYKRVSLISFPALFSAAISDMLK